MAPAWKPRDLLSVADISRINKERKLAMAGYVRIKSNKETLKAIVESKVPSDGLAVGEYIWVARWVKDALDTYHQNDGYAGLPLVDFLKKLNDGQVNEAR